MAKVKDLFKAYNQNELPIEGGYIITAFFDPNSSYSRYEVTSYNNVKEIHSSESGLTFMADGKKFFVLVEPTNYAQKHQDPAYRDDAHKIPYRFKELEIFTTRRQDKVMIGKEPTISYGSFTIMKTSGTNFSLIFYNTEDVLDAVVSFFADSLWKEAHVPRTDAVKVSKLIRKLFDEFIQFKIS